jgi:hypothetical protein
MASRASDKHSISYVPVAIGAVSLAILIAALLYLNRSHPASSSDNRASAEAKAYVSHLQLSDVSMQAAENFMQQQVVEVLGKITNSGNRPLHSVDIYCLFYDVSGKMIHRERVPIVRATGKPLASGETRDFRLPFDSLPEEWNEAVPHLVVAQIKFAQ